LVFTVPGGPAVNATLIDMGNRFRMVVNEVDVIQPERPLMKLPVACAVWLPRPNIKVAAGAWILAGGAHHTGFSQSVTRGHLEDFASMAGLELLIIDNDTKLVNWKNEIKWNDMYYLLAKGL
jgi:L-arabinose isomerase